ncbi:MAG: hypothetical protein LH632_20595 [Rhodoferax sp.]|nr:hypothetical protein [Rhodoferax sp.]
MPINNQTPDPRFQRVLIAARELVKHEVDERGTNVEWSLIASALQRLCDALADLEVDGAVAANSIKKNPASAVRPSVNGR